MVQDCLSLDNRSRSAPLEPRSSVPSRLLQTPQCYNITPCGAAASSNLSSGSRGPRFTVRAARLLVPATLHRGGAAVLCGGLVGGEQVQTKMHTIKFGNQTSKGLPLSKGGLKRGVGGPPVVLLAGPKGWSYPRCIDGVVGNAGAFSVVAARFPRKDRGPRSASPAPSLPVVLARGAKLTSLVLGSRAGR